MAALGLWLFVVGGPQAEVKVIKPQFIRASRALEALKMAAPDLDVSLQADDRLGSLRVAGAKSDVDAVETYMVLLDVRPRYTKLRILIDSPADKMQRKVVCDMPNNGDWGMEDESLDLSLKIRVHINDNLTRTLTIDSRCRGARELSTLTTTRNGVVCVRPGYVALNGSELLKKGPRASRRFAEADEKTIPTVWIEPTDMDPDQTWGEPKEFAPKGRTTSL